MPILTLPSADEDPDPLIPEDPHFFSIPDPAPEVAPYPASGKPKGIPFKEKLNFLMIDLRDDLVTGYLMPPIWISNVSYMTCC